MQNLEHGDSDDFHDDGTTTYIYYSVSSVKNIIHINTETLQMPEIFYNLLKL